MLFIGCLSNVVTSSCREIREEGGEEGGVKFGALSRWSYLEVLVGVSKFSVDSIVGLEALRPP